MYMKCSQYHLDENQFSELTLLTSLKTTKNDEQKHLEKRYTKMNISVAGKLLFLCCMIFFTFLM